MTEKETNSCKSCIVCTGCGRGAGKERNLQAVDSWQEAQGLRGKSQYGQGGPLLVATDIGTTTIVMQLRRVSDGAVFKTFRAVNPQRKYGLDVLSRIRAASAAADMQQAVCKVLEQGLRELTEPDGTENETCAESLRRQSKLPILGMAIAANTTMVHLLMGYSADGLGRAPFQAEHLEEIHTRLPLSGYDWLDTVILPGFSAFVGGDVFAGVYACGMGEEENLTLLLDLGTNGEIVLGNRHRLLATATAAGPAFEGRLEAGVWGADAVHFLARLYEKGLVDETGLLTEEYFEEGVSIGGISMSQEDIRSLQLAKAAVHGGIRVLCEEYGIRDLQSIKKVYLAGGFGYYLRPEDAVRIGLLPKELGENCVAVGNAALEGAFLYGREYFGEGRREREAGVAAAADWKAKTQVYNLAEAHTFEQYYIEAINLPKGD